MKIEEITSKAENLFVKKECNLKSPLVKAAIITAASKMANPSNIVTEETALEILSDAYNVWDDEKVALLIGMGPQFVESTIGYSGFDDMASAIVNYRSNKQEYDVLYTAIEVQKKQKDLGRSKPQETK